MKNLNTLRVVIYSGSWRMRLVYCIYTVLTLPNLGGAMAPWPPWFLRLCCDKHWNTEWLTSCRTADSAVSEIGNKHHL